MSPQDREELSPNLSFPELMASSLKPGLVRLGEGQEDGDRGWWEEREGGDFPPIFFPLAQ